MPEKYPIDMIFNFLKENEDNFFTTTQLSNNLNLSPQQVRNCTKQLYKRNMIVSDCENIKLYKYKYDKRLEKFYNEI